MTDYTSLKDEELIPLVRKKDSLAEDELYARYKTIVKGKAHTFFLLGGDVEDIIQEGMIGLYKAVYSFDSDKNDSFKGYAQLCISRQIQTAIKMAARKKHSPLNESLSLDTPVSDKEDSPSLVNQVATSQESNPESLLISSELAKELSSGIRNNLSAMEQKVLSLYSSGYSYAAIAKAIDKSEKSVDNALQRIKKKLSSVVSKQ